MDGAIEDTICAVATPAGEGGIGIVRISGSLSLSIAGQIVRLRSNQPLSSVASHTLHLADIVLPSRSAQIDNVRPHQLPSGGEIIDEGLVVFMKGPRSFTSEDSVEIHCHGGSVVLDLVCQACLIAGARLAQPGEFTKRAFLHGRLDLSQAEAVLDTIRSKSEAALKLAQRHLRGELGRHVDRLRANLVGLLAQVEAGIDFSDEDLSFVAQAELAGSLQDTRRAIRVMLDAAEHGRRLREGARVVIAGRPNVGKSSLLNSFLGEDRAIVTEIPGTTRDVLEGSVVWKGMMMTLVDTAGLRETADVVELEGIKRTRSALEQADLVLHVLDAAEFEEYGAEDTGRIPEHQRGITVINKSDLVNTDRMMDLVKMIQTRTGGTVIPISVRTGVGLDALRASIQLQLAQKTLEPTESVAITKMRHRDALERADALLAEALTSIHDGAGPEFVAMDLRGAADALGEVTGVITSDDVLHRIFSEFCIGK
ncbi:MAG: tRNA uridine-5-carboxymethylaminomethyl(34) synthesis GTPase MnmE [Nitrospira sp.]|nr:tRNA uridine-5-carboxymethylaminomethyl(34) synthesis GTPase MnmE [Nitrospira sp.]